MTQADFRRILDPGAAICLRFREHTQRPYISKEQLT